MAAELNDFETDFAPLFDPPLQPVERVRNIEVHTFHRKYRDQRVPVLIEGETDDWPALRRWPDLQYLKRVVGRAPIYVRDLGRCNISNVGYRESYRSVDFCDFIDGISAPIPEELYLTQGKIRRPTGVLRAFERAAYPALLTALSDDLKTPRFWRAEQTLQTNLWLGPGGHGSALHFDEFENLNALITGSKRWLIFPSSEVVKLTAGRHGVRQSIARGFHAAEPGRFEPTVRRALRGWQCVTHPGDLLYVPLGAWHQVFSGSGLSMAVNFWFLRLPHDASRVALFTARRIVGFRSRRRLALALAAVYLDAGRRFGSYAVQRLMGSQFPAPKIGATRYN